MKVPKASDKTAGSKPSGKDGVHAKCCECGKLFDGRNALLSHYVTAHFRREVEEAGSRCTSSEDRFYSSGCRFYVIVPAKIYGQN
jgi:hypothetical protein